MSLPHFLTASCLINGILLTFDRNPCFHGVCVKHHPFNIIGGAIAITYLKDMFRWQKCFEKYTLNLYPIVHPKEFRSGLNSHVFLQNKITWASSLIPRFTASKAMQERPRRHEVSYGGASQITLNAETEVVADLSAQRNEANLATVLFASSETGRSLYLAQLAEKV